MEQFSYWIKDVVLLWYYCTENVLEFSPVTVCWYWKKCWWYFNRILVQCYLWLNLWKENKTVVNWRNGEVIGRNCYTPRNGNSEWKMQLIYFCWQKKNIAVDISYFFKPESDTTVLKEYWFCIFTGIKNDISEKKTSQGERWFTKKKLRIFALLFC